MKTIITITLIALTVIKLSGQTPREEGASSFDQEKWNTTSSYRYEMMHTEEFFEITDLEKEQVISILGIPHKIDGETLTYCLDIEKAKSSHNKSICDGSWFSINFKLEKEDILRVTIARVGG
ncbi:hypothetical protein O3Q51_17745 [Cryomorphaceae bacterium 1068]|nr:hypothetical protein [Cryomorphaceae bacterium 1068]